MDRRDYNNVGNGQSGSSGAAGWSGEATLDIDWAYAIAPHAHLVLFAVPRAESEGVQGFPNLFKAIDQAIEVVVEPLFVRREIDDDRLARRGPRSGHSAAPDLDIA